MSHPKWIELSALDNGAKFLNADLHIHTFGGSSDVKDTTMTPQAIVDSAIRQKLSVIGWMLALSKVGQSLVNVVAEDRQHGLAVALHLLPFLLAGC
jgi:hypothetical protein